MPVLANTRIEGESVGSVGTCIRIPSLKLAFDIGRCPEAAVHAETVLITHGHMDHIGGVGHHCARRELLRLPPPTYVMGPEVVLSFRTLMDAFRGLDCSRLDYNLVMLEPGEEHRLPGGKVVRPFRSRHVLPCQGYGIWSTRRKLKAKYRDKPGHKIAKLRARGVEVSEEVLVPEVAFTGDTNIDVIVDEPVVRQARLLIMECTFIDGKMPPDKTYDIGHIHLEHIADQARIGMFENEAVLLTHFSPRHKPREIREAVDALPDALRGRVSVLTPPG
jgi:ribonuclease Z